jgi:branched-chain amino acid transport system ATP-binding protein
MTGHQTRLALARHPVRSLLWAAWIGGGLALTGIVEAPAEAALALDTSGPLVPASLTGMALACGLVARRSSAPSPSPALAAGGIGLLFVGMAFRPAVSVAGLLIATAAGGWAVGAASAAAAAAARRAQSAAAGLSLAAAAGGIVLLPVSPLWLMAATAACLLARSLTQEPPSSSGLTGVGEPAGTGADPLEHRVPQAVPSEGPLPEQPVLSVSRVALRFGDRAVLRGASLSLRRGELVGLAGGNGSGKSTLLRVLGGHLVPDEGDVFLDGASVLGAAPEELCRAGITLVSGARPVFPDLTVEENLRVAAWSALPSGPAEARVAALETFPELEPLLARTAGTLSGGEQRLVALAQSLVVKPQVLLADEVTLGLSPPVRQRVWGLLRQLADQGSAVLVVDHELAEMSALSDRVLVLDGGTLTEGPAESGRARFITLGEEVAGRE